MSHTWKYGGIEYPVIQVPMAQLDSVSTKTLTLTANEDLQNVFLYTDGDYEDVVTAKLSTQSSYRSIQTYSITPSCFLGNIGEDETVTIQFRISFPSGEGYIGEEIIPIYVGHGSNITPFYYPEDDIFWISDSDSMWQWLDSTEEFDEYCWRSEV